MNRLISGIKNETGFINLLKDINLLKKEIEAFKNDKEFIRVFKYIRKITENKSHQMTEIEKIEFIKDLLHTFIVCKLRADKEGKSIDPIDIIDIMLNTNNFNRTYDLILSDGDEYLLEYELYTRNSFSLYGYNDKEGNIENIQTTHKKKRMAKYYKRINSVRIPQKLIDILNVIKDADISISTVVSNLFIKEKVHEINPEKVLEFNLKLKDKFPQLYENKKNITFSVMLPAYFRWVVYIRKTSFKKRNNKIRELTGLGGLLYFIIFKRKFPNLLPL